MPTRSSSHDGKRFERYQCVLAKLLESPDFSLSEVRASLGDDATLASKIVTLLCKEGRLERIGPKTRPSFRWLAAEDEFSAAAWIETRIYNARIKRAPQADRPRERLLAQGVAALRDAELLAILVRSGLPGESAVAAGEKIAARYMDRLERLADAGRGELKAVSPAVGDAAWCQIMAGIELGRRVRDAVERRERDDAVRGARIRDTDDAVAWCQKAFERLAADGLREEFHIVTLGTKNQVINRHPVSVGLLDQSLAHPREVFLQAIRDSAKSILLVHNHPSGDPTPSEQDLALTRRLEEAGRTVGIQVLDHVVVARQGAVSVREFQQRRDGAG